MSDTTPDTLPPEKREEEAAPPTAAVAAAPTTAAVACPPVCKRTPGDNGFDLLTYGIVGGVGNFILSMVAGYWARYGGGSKHIGGFSKAMQNAGMSKTHAEDAIMTTALMMGGNAIIVPIKALENNRAEIVGSINETMGHATTAAEKAEEKTDQTWASLIKSRLLAWAIVFSSFKAAAHFAGPQNFEKFEKDFANNVVCKPLGRPTHINGAETTTYKYGRIAALDFFATVAASSILYVSSRFLGDKKAKERAGAEASKKAQDETVKQMSDAHRELANELSTAQADSCLKPANEVGDKDRPTCAHPLRIPAEQKASENEAISSAHTAQVKRENASSVASRSQPETYAEKIRDTARGTELVLGV